MHKIDTPTALPGGVFTEGDPVIPVAATEVSADWLNAVQAEIIGVIEGAGIELAKADNSQLLAAIRALLPQAATTSLAGLVELATAAEVAALSDASRAVTPAGLAAVLPQAATTALAGLVELATNAEVAALADTSRAVTPAGLASVLPQAATTALAGLLRLATTAEAQAGASAAGAVTPATLRAGLNASGSAPVYAPRAWVTFRGTDTVAVIASGNVSSVTDGGVGIYTINFATAMPDANYAVAIAARKENNVDDGNISASYGNTDRVPSTTACPITTSHNGTAAVDFPSISVTIIR